MVLWPEGDDSGSGEPAGPGGAGCDEADAPVRLAAGARDALRALHLRTSGPVDGDILAGPGEMHAVLGSLKSLVDDLSHCLPELATWLEQRLWCGGLATAPGPRAYADVAESTFEVASALARAQRMCGALARELDAAQAASGDLVVSDL
ncbi:hypothetical protein [Saccharomonospora saliphila]|uniref:hypothetical protein n=1 Tax=Saccharomonospora saliphila TaxID=369829 RepID=UPI0003664AEE|nr:hypothetical protein [Saccharomonospora saliphila]